MLFVIAAMMVGCAADESPKGVVEKATKCLQDKDYEGYVNMLYGSSEQGEKAEKAKQFMVEMIKHSMEKAEKENGKTIKSFDVQTETISEDGMKAEVEMKVLFSNGDEESETVKLKKEENGKWRINLGR